jgi:hypothetical protein
MISCRLPRWVGLAPWWAVGSAVFALSFTRLASPDLGFHLATGRAVLSLGHIPATNLLSFTEPDHPWILHEWLPAVLFELAWRKSGPAGVLAVKLVVVVATWLLVLLTARRLGASPLAAGIATLLGAGAAASRFSERPQIFSALALAGCALLLATAARAETGRARGRWIVAVGLVVAVAAHIHAGAITSFTLLAAVAAGLALEPLRVRIFGAQPCGPAGFGAAGRVAAVAAGAVVLAAITLALYHPQGARSLLVPLQLGSDADLHEHVVEYRSPFAFSFRQFHLFWAFGAIATAAAVLQIRRLPATLLVPVLIFAALSLEYVRTIDAFAIVTAPVLAVSLDGMLAGRIKDSWMPLIGLVALAGLTVGLPLDHGAAVPPGVGIVESVWPTPMFRFIEEQGLAGPAFVSDGWAGPFLGVFYPRERVFFDPRFEAYSPGFGRDVYRRVLYGAPGWQDLLDRYGVQLVLLKYTSSGEARFEEGRENLRQHLARSPAWALVGFGDTGEIFVRCEGVNGGAAARFAIPGVEPDRGLFFVEPALAAVPLVRAVDNGFQDNRVLALAAVAVGSAGNLPLAVELLERADGQRLGDPQVLEARRALGR